ncbi:5-histidylcysteine sulfoxide synthase [Actinophytocola xanthii]|nr:5-histidylcysteine sulfoxide synthase [Actinophytocola xanthii]
MWETNATEHADERLTGRRDPGWWFTGQRPDRGTCPGVGPDGRLTSLPMPDLSVCGRDEVVDYFNNSWTLQETLFAGLQTSEAFYRPPDHGLRHPMIFYYGHPAALYVNKLRVSGLLEAPVDAYLEDVLETGVDEMSWDDMSKNEMRWPSVAAVREYRATVYRTMLQVIESTPFAPDLGRPVTMDDQAWALFLAFEHDRVHLETSSVLIRELPRRLVRQPEEWPLPTPIGRVTESGRPSTESYPDNDLVTIPAGTARLGKPWDFPSFGWDNEYGTREQEVSEFDTARFLVSNGEFHEFVVDGGYRRPELWSEEGERWRRFRNAKWPRWWVQAGPTGLHTFRLRTTFDEIDMPWDWPVCVNYHEAKAFCAWRSQKDDRTYRLPTEFEFNRLRDLPAKPTADDDRVLRAAGDDLRARGVNLNLAWGSESPVDHSPATGHGVHDVGGNLWTWSEDVANPLEGFTVHPYYEDFSVPCFDGQHQMILGGCFVSTGDQASIWARYHFRPHFLQQAGIRLVSAAEPAASAAPPAQAAAPDREEDRYERHEVLDRYLLMHFGDEQDTFGRPDHPLAAAHGYPARVAELLVRAAARAGTPLHRVLDVGSSVGGVAFEIASRVPAEVVGIDRSTQFVDTANALAAGKTVPYERPEQAERSTLLFARAPRPVAGGGVEFRTGDAAALSPELGSFTAVVLANLLDRLDDPLGCLRQFIDSTALLRPGGLLVVGSPWSWQPAFTDRQRWIGGADQSSEQALRRLLTESFDLVAESNEAGVMRDHRRHYEFFDADVTVWRKC